MGVSRPDQKLGAELQLLGPGTQRLLQAWATEWGVATLTVPCSRQLAWESGE